MTSGVSQGHKVVQLQFLHTRKSFKVAKLNPKNCPAWA
jgi:hypothetical protein